jgi:hypothetical protein
MNLSNPDVFVEEINYSAIDPYTYPSEKYEC